MKNKTPKTRAQGIRPRAGNVKARGVLLVGLVVLLLLGFFLSVSLLARAYHVVGVSVRDYASADVRYANGETHHSDSAYFGTVNRGDVVTVTLSLPIELRIPRAALCFSIYHSVTEVKWGEQLLDAYGADLDARGAMIGLKQFTVSIPDEAWGDAITITLRATEDNAFARIKTMMLYPEKQAFQYLWDTNLLGFWSSVPMMMIGAIMLVIMPFVRGRVKLEGVCISSFILLLSLYIVSTGILPFLGMTQYCWQLLEFIFVYLLSCPLLCLVILSQPNGKLRYCAIASLCVNLAFFAVATVLNFTTSIHYCALLRYAHLLTAINCFLLLVYSLCRAKDGRRSSQAYLLGFLAVFTVGLFELLRTNIPFLVKGNLPSVLHIGMMCFAIMLIVSYILSFSEARRDAADALQRKGEELRKEKEQMQLLKQELEQNRIKVLLSQIQPHFIYNTLGSIRMIIMQDPDKASDLLYQFTLYLRSNIKALSSDAPQPFAEELKNTQAYLSIERMRFGDKLKTDFQIECDDFCVVPLTIQPIVENAVKHGIFEKGTEGGTVTVHSFQTADSYGIEVRDDGVGFDVEKELKENTNSFGLKNLIYRLESLMSATVEIQSELGKGTLVTVTIPKRQEEHDENAIR